MELQEMKEQLVEWMDAMKNGYRDSEIYMYEFESDSRKSKALRIRLFTDINDYSIVAYPKTDEYRSYLGCTYSSRRPRAGEDWTRGGDLADGDFSTWTWTKILSDIIGTELVKIHNPIKFLYMDNVRHGEVIE